MNPLNYERFNRLFHITNNLALLVRKLDVDGVQSGYIKKLQEEIDQLFLDNATEEKKQ